MNAIFQITLAYLLTTILFIVYYFFGLTLLRRFAKTLSKKLTNLELIFISFFFGLFFQIWISFITALLIKNITLAHIISILIALISIFLNKKSLIKINLFEEIKKHKAAFIVFLIVILILLNTVFFRFGDGKMYNGPLNYGDWALHISLINNFAKGNNIPPMYTFYSGTRMGYPFLSFYGNAILVNLGLDIYHAFNTYQVILTFSLLTFIYLLGNRLFGKKASAILFSILLFFGAGLGWIYVFNGESLLTSIAEEDFFVLHDQNILPISLSIYAYSQRTGLLGWIFIFTVFILLFEEIFKLQNWKKIKDYPLIILLLGGLFFFHSYSFLIIMLFLFTIWVQKPAKSLFLLLLSSAILSLPQIFWTRSQTIKKSFFKLIHGLFVSITEPLAFIWMWLKNFGAMLLFAIFGLKKYKHLWLPFVVFFVFGNTIVLQPWEWDNQKLFTTCYFILAIFGVAGIQRLWEGKRRLELYIRRGVILFVIFLILAPSIMALYHYHKQKFNFSNKEDQALGEFIGELIPQDSIILTGTQHNHPVFLYTGRKVFEGYRGWIWTHGLDLGDKDKELKAMFESKNKKEACRLFNEHNIDYVFISKWERRQRSYNLNEPFFKNNFKIVYNENNNYLFKIEC